MKVNQLQKRLGISLLVASAIAALETIGGLVSNSLALLSDAGHIAADVLALTLAFVAIRFSTRPHTTASTFGYHRLEVLTALVNGAVLFVVAGFVLVDAYRRFFTPREVDALLLLIIAAVGLIANVFVMVFLREGSKLNIGVRAAFLHVMSDTLSSVGVMVGAIIITFTGILLVDTVVAVLISGLIIRGGLRLVKDTGRILLEQAPTKINTAKLAEEILKVEGVGSIHELHVWSVTYGMNILSAHIVIDEHHKDHEVVGKINQMLRSSFNISHTTLQIDHQKQSESLLKLGTKAES
jgi:cobalt-zinc-cadmium efflux system protein